MKVAKNEVVILTVKGLFLSVCSPEADPGTRILMQVVYLEGAPMGEEWGSDSEKGIQSMYLHYKISYHTE